jgi:hypothetical protein
MTYDAEMSGDAVVELWHRPASGVRTIYARMKPDRQGTRKGCPYISA